MDIDCNQIVEIHGAVSKAQAGSKRFYAGSNYNSLRRKNTDVFGAARNSGQRR
jgi:hypothetical protein